MLAIAQDKHLTDDQDAALDAGPRKVAAGVSRLCAATAEVKPVADMIRFVVAPDGSVVPDLKQRLPGRGLWVTATREALARAVSRKVFARGFRREVKADAGLIDMTDRLLEKAALESLAMALKARRLLAGFAKVEAAIAHEPVIALLHASDAARDGVRKLDAAWRNRTEDDTPAATVDRSFTSAQLDLALGRPNVVHAALLAGPESDAFLARLARLSRFRAGKTPAGAVDRTKSPEEQDRNG